MSNRKPISKRTRFDILNRDGFACRYCGAKAPDAVLEIDHVKPVAGGGCDCLSNLVTACHACNRGKGVTVLYSNSHSSLDEKNEQAWAIQKRTQEWFSDKRILIVFDVLASLLSGRTEESILRYLERCDPTSERDKDKFINSIRDDLVRYIDQVEGGLA